MTTKEMVEKVFTSRVIMVAVAIATYVVIFTAVAIATYEGAIYLGIDPSSALKLGQITTISFSFLFVCFVRSWRRG